MKKIINMIALVVVLGSGQLVAQENQTSFTSAGYNYRPIAVQSALSADANVNVVANGIYAGRQVRELQSNKVGSISGVIVVKHDGTVTKAALDLPSGAKTTSVGGRFWLIEYPKTIELQQVSIDLMGVAGVERAEMEVLMQRKMAM
ncbi:hypothetical protein [Pelagibaculum spongiae]|uniref:Uncharacterized protein n=1 Tax=Pelagibaculum spongiae TaxID=2080658 RepID=A0A2V1GUQ7_9GAMM|nr:hypothetical protein [Pelagibaculum spongiae]PVZ63415.1 hypothetical protein DC094_21130 [Pelagibaculum spongiae]